MSFIKYAGTSLSALKVAAPATFDCGLLGVRSVTFNWSAVQGATSYTLHYGQNGTSTRKIAAPSTSAQITTLISGGTAWVEADRDFASTTWTSAPSRTRSYTVAIVSLCA